MILTGRWELQIVKRFTIKGYGIEPCTCSLSIGITSYSCKNVPGAKINMLIFGIRVRPATLRPESLMMAAPAENCPKSSAYLPISSELEPLPHLTRPAKNSSRFIEEAMTDRFGTTLWKLKPVAFLDWERSMSG